jgi:hydrogenase maturation protein HypF
MALRRRFIVTGQVQGVGFRPFVYRIAHENAVTGLVRNTPEGVVIEVQGSPEQVDGFGHHLEHSLPPLARIVSLEREDLAPLEGEEAFSIQRSTTGQGHTVLISPDVATCADCLADMADPGNRRHFYPFTNCTNCGPRYTITRSIPYDRDKTSMACFPLCPECRAEYEDPLDRRFHAQPNACPVCGPRVWLAGRDGAELARGRQALQRLAEFLAEGRICAVKGLGGFHLACDATNADAVLELRARKNRWDKPLAVMVPDLGSARMLADIGEAEAEWLSGIRRPIVLCRAQAPSPLAPAVSPDTDSIGLMLPYTPLHHLLFRCLQDVYSSATVPALVMTSGNTSSEPISLGNREALRRLSRIADRFLFHDRDILIRTDDSVLRVHPESGDPLFLRRARGFTPSPVFLPRLEGGQPTVLGTGPELKNTLCLTKGDQAFVSQHIGDMENLETLGFYQEIAAHLESILQVTPELIVRDLHPDYMTTRWAEEQGEERGLPVRALQHHFAHAHSVLAEHCFAGRALCLALDGTGYGEDGTLWGGELLLVDTGTLEHRRLAHFSPVRLPGGEQAIREPWRIAQSFLWELGATEPDPERPWPWLAEYGAASALLPQLLEKHVNAPVTTSCGRLFDGVAALLDCRQAITYEGQAAILLERLQDPSETGAYPCACAPADGDAPAVLDTLDLFRSVWEDWRAGEDPARIARRFHLGLVQGLADLARDSARALGLEHVALSGGVMQNLTMAVELPKALEARGLTPLVHTRVPPNDACIALGQAAWGRLLLAQGPR